MFRDSISLNAGLLVTNRQRAAAFVPCSCGGFPEHLVNMIQNVAQLWTFLGLLQQCSSCMRSYGSEVYCCDSFSALRCLEIAFQMGLASYLARCSR